MTNIPSIPCAHESPRLHAMAIMRAALLTLSTTVRTWTQRKTQRKALRTLDAHLRNDIGITRDAQNHESAKPFWQA